MLRRHEQARQVDQLGAFLVLEDSSEEAVEQVDVVAKVLRKTVALGIEFEEGAHGCY